VCKEILGEFGFNLEVYIVMLIYFLTAIGLTSLSSSTVHIYTQTTQLILGRVPAVPIIASNTVAFTLQLRKNTEKYSVREAQECQLAR
jgi:hypothetical protein